MKRWQQSEKSVVFCKCSWVEQSYGLGLAYFCNNSRLILFVSNIEPLKVFSDLREAHFHVNLTAGPKCTSFRDQNMCLSLGVSELTRNSGLFHLLILKVTVYIQFCWSLGPADMFLHIFMPCHIFMFNYIFTLTLNVIVLPPIFLSTFCQNKPRGSHKSVSQSGTHRCYSILLESAILILFSNSCIPDVHWAKMAITCLGIIIKSPPCSITSDLASKW